MRELVLYVLLLLLLVPAPGMHTSAYTTCDGISPGDIIVIDYEGTFANGTQFDKGTNQDFTVSKTELIDGFYSNLLGMKISDKKSFVVPPEDGYTNPNHPFNGMTLYFDVYIANVLSEIQTCVADQDTTTSDTLLTILNTILILISSTIIILYLRRLFIRQSTKPCVHCLEKGRNTLSTGFCGKCGAAHCDPSFSRGCTVCKSTTFVRN